MSEEFWDKINKIHQELYNKYQGAFRKIDPPSDYLFLNALTPSNFVEFEEREDGLYAKTW